MRSASELKYKEGKVFRASVKKQKEPGRGKERWVDQAVRWSTVVPVFHI